MRVLLTQLGWDLRLGLLWMALYAGGARANMPMPMDVYGDADNAERLYVLLPGIRDRKDDFRKEGFVSAAQEALKGRKDIAIVALDAHYGYYRSRTVEQRIDEALLQRWPDKRITLVGVSLGGFGALMVAEDHPDRVDEILLLSPFLGPAGYLDRVRRQDFSARKGDTAIETRLNRLWPFLQKNRTSPHITLAYGSDDDFAPFYQALRRTGKDIRFDEIEGGHEWKTWNALWKRWLNHSLAGGS